MTNMDTGKLCPSSRQNTNIVQRQNGCQSEICKGYGSTGCICRIRELNDKLRTSMSGGLIHMTDGIAALGLSKVNAIFKAISAFSDFGLDNDPWGEHDCAVMEIEGQRIIWKVDYYDRSRTCHSPDAADPKATVRVLTVMLSDDVRVQHQWNRMRDLKIGGFLAHRSPMENEDETEIRTTSSIVGAGCKGHPPGHQEAPCG